MNFEYLLVEAQCGDQNAIEKIICMYRPLLIKKSIVNGIFDEDLYQELSITLLKCIRKFSV